MTRNEALQILGVVDISIRDHPDEPDSVQQQRRADIGKPMTSQELLPRVSGPLRLCTLSIQRQPPTLREPIPSRARDAPVKEFRCECHELHHVAVRYAWLHLLVVTLVTGLGIARGDHVA